MKAAFVHSARLNRLPDGRVFSGGQFPYALWKRYLRYFKELTVITRVRDVESVGPNEDESSGPLVEFVGLPDDHGDYLQQLRIRRHTSLIDHVLSTCDCLVVRSSAIGWLAAERAFRRNIPFLVEVVGDPFNALWHHGSLIAKMRAPLAWLTARHWIQRSPFVTYVTESYLQTRYPTSGVAACLSDVILENVPDLVLQKRISKIQSHARGSSSSYRVGLIGDWFARHKGIDVACKALAQLRLNGHDVTLHILGRGPADRWSPLAHRIGISNYVHFEGALPAGQCVYDWLDGLDLYIQPSLTEGLPRSLIEAMSRGLPCLASACGGIPQLLPQQCLHRPGNHRQLVSHIVRLITCPALRARLAKHNFLGAQRFYHQRLCPIRDDFYNTFRQSVSSLPKETNHFY